MLHDDPDWLRKQYVELRLSVYKISRMAGVSDGTIRNRLDKFNIPKRSRIDAQGIRSGKLGGLHKDREWLYAKYITERKSSIEIAEIVGRTSPTVIYFLRKYGIPIRSGSEANAIWQDANAANYKNKEWLEDQYIKRGLYLETIAVSCVVTDGVIDYWLKKHGIAKRSRKGLGSALWKRPEYRSKQIAVRKELASDPVQREFLRSISQKHWDNITPEEREAFSRGCQYVRTDEHRAKMSLAHTGKKHSELHRQHLSEVKKIFYKNNPQHITKMVLAASTKRPTLPEKLVDEMTSAEVRYVGNKKWWRKLDDGKFHNPDFKVTGQNKVIEVYGDYWHRNDDPNKIIGLYKRGGIDCLVLWESEIKKQPALAKEKLSRFLSA